MAPRDRSSFTRTPRNTTAGIWRRLARPFVLTEVVDVLMGLRPEVVEAFGAVKVCSSDRAAALLAAMPALSRSLATSVGSQAIRSRGEVRGPVLWSETMWRRASSFGDEDLFVCTAPRRMRHPREPGAGPGAAHARRLDRGPRSGSRHVARRPTPVGVRARQLARSARGWADHPSLSQHGGSSRRGPAWLPRAVAGRQVRRPLRTGARPARGGRFRAPLGPADLVALCDRRTRPAALGAARHHPRARRTAA